jgi:hypothetical protein
VNPDKENAMNPLKPLKPLKVFTDAITFPFTAIFVIGLTGFINWMTSPGHWWFQWVAFGMVIALISIWARALKALALTLGVVGIAGLIWYAVRKWRNRDHAGKPASV